MGNIDSIVHAENICEAKTRETFPEIIEYYEELYTFYLNISENYCKTIPDGIVQRPVAIFFLNDRILKSLYCAFDLLKRGHYNECRSIQRDVLEAVCLVEYILQNPTVSESWFNGDQLTFGRIKKKIELWLGDDVIFGHLCDYTHPNVNSNIRECVIVENKGVYFSFMPDFQKNMSHSSFVLLSVLTYRAMTNYLKFIKKYENGISNEDSKRLKKIQEKLQNIAKFLEITYDSDT